LPRNANGKLQQQALERIVAQWKDAAGAPNSGQFEFVVALDHPALAGHFPGRPIVPGVLLLDRVLVRLSAALDRPLTRLRQVKFTAALLPGEVARVAFERDAGRVRFQVEAQRHGAPVQLASGSALLAAPAGAA
jgi:3-hydroxymyristoyl/3-hydroxydecanoyl-(acyl carrier protein) dehydratase